MNKIILVAIISIFVIGSLIAVGELTSISKDISLTSAQKTALTSKGLSDYKVSDYTIGTDEVERCLHKEQVINTCQRFQTYYIVCNEYDKEDSSKCLDEEKVYHKADELETMKDNWEKQRLEGIADATIKRTADAKTKVAEGTTTVKDTAVIKP